MDLGRVHGISTTASIALIGALSSTGNLDLGAAFGIILISCFAHTAPAAYMELNDIKLDSQIPESSKKPLVCGAVTKRETKLFVLFGMIVSFSLAILFFPKVIAIIPLSLSALWVMWYCNGVGKRMLFSYDYAFAIAYSFYALFGAFAIGAPTIYTWIFIVIVAIQGGVFAQWENGLKDVDADRRAGIKSIAAQLNISSTTKLKISHPYFIYGLVIKITFLLFCFIAYLQSLSVYYLVFLLICGVPSQSYIMYRFLAKRGRLEQRKTVLLDVPISAILGFSVIAGKVGVLPILLVLLFLIGGYLKGSLWQYGTEFKFARYRGA